MDLCKFVQHNAHAPFYIAHVFLRAALYQANAKFDKITYVVALFYCVPEFKIEKTNISRDQIWLNSNLNSTIKWFWDGYACRFVWFWFQSWFKISDNFRIVSSSQSFQQCNDAFSFKVCTFLITFTTYSENLISEKCIFAMNSGGSLWNIYLKVIENKIGWSRFRFKIIYNPLIAKARSIEKRLTSHFQCAMNDLCTYDWTLKLIYLNSSSSLTHSSIVWIVIVDIEIAESVRSTVWFPTVVLVAFRLSFGRVEGNMPATDAPWMNNGVSQVFILNYKMRMKKF